MLHVMFFIHNCYNAEFKQFVGFYMIIHRYNIITMYLCNGGYQFNIKLLNVFFRYKTWKKWADGEGLP